MKTSYFLRYALLAVSLLVIGCKDDDPAPDPLSLLPPATQYGAETWGAIINGEAVYSSRADYHYMELRSGSDMTLYLSSDNDEWGDVIFTIREQPVKVGEYILSNETTASGRYAGVNNTGCLYEYSDLLNGILYITKFDPANEKVIAGTFEFTSAKDGCDTLRVRNGRFDIITSY